MGVGAPFHIYANIAIDVYAKKDIHIYIKASVNIIRIYTFVH